MESAHWVTPPPPPPDAFMRVQGAMEGWADFTQDIRNFYGVDMSCLDNCYRREQKEYYLETSAWADIHPSQLLGPVCCFKEYDLLHITLEELAAPLQVETAAIHSSCNACNAEQHCPV